MAKTKPALGGIRKKQVKAEITKIKKVKDNNTTQDGDKVKQPDGNDTVFIRNLSFETEELEFKKFIEENFGPTKHCLICRDKETQDSKGTGFARFVNPSDAKKCLEEFKNRDLLVKFHLDGRNLIVLPALPRDRIQTLTKEKEKKDKRNLGLAAVGSFKPDSEELQEMSKSDREKRKVLHLRKRDKLKNLHNFVSDVRLCIHNLPPNLDDTGLRRVFLKAMKDEASDAKIIECRVMRNKKSSGQLTASKGFGFVAFSKHEHALLALRKVNNNPTIFSKDKRPIVEFSIENLVALNKKKTRLANSKRKIGTIKS